LAVVSPNAGEAPQPVRPRQLVELAGAEVSERARRVAEGAHLVSRRSLLFEEEGDPLER